MCKAKDYWQYYRYCQERWIRPLKVSLDCFKQGGGHYIGDCTPTRDWGQSEVKQSRQNFEAGQIVKPGSRGSLEMVKGSPSTKIGVVKISTTVVGGSTVTYVVFPLVKVWSLPSLAS